MEKIDRNNYELWLMQYNEGTLGEADREMVVQWLAENKDIADEYKLFSEAPRLTANKQVHYTGAPLEKNNSFLRWTIAAAVVAALLLPLSIRLMTHGIDGDNTIEVAQVLDAPMEKEENADVEREVNRCAETNVSKKSADVKHRYEEADVTVEPQEEPLMAENVASIMPEYLAVLIEDGIMTENGDNYQQLMIEDSLIVFLDYEPVVNRAMIKDLSVELIKRNPTTNRVRNGLRYSSQLLAALF